MRFAASSKPEQNLCMFLGALGLKILFALKFLLCV